MVKSPVAWAQMRTPWPHGSAAGSGIWRSSFERGPTGEEYHMSDSTGPHLDDSIDRYARRELTPAEARELAQKSLDDPELFEDLTASALAAAAAAAPSAKVIRFPRKFMVAGAVAAAVVVLIAVYSVRRSQPSQPHAAPALASSAKPGQPILLASELE